MRTSKLFFLGTTAALAVACNKSTDDTPFMMSATDATNGGETESDSESDSEPEDDDDGGGPCGLGGDGPAELSSSSDDMPGQVLQIQIVGGEKVSCGDGFVAVAGGNDIDIDGTCTGLAAVGNDAVALTVGSSVHVFELDGDSLSELDDASVGSTALDVASDGEKIIVAAGDTLAAFDFDGSSLSEDGSLASVTNVRSVAAAGSGWIIVEQNGTVTLLDSGGDENGEYTDSTTPVRVESDGEWAIVMRGGFGIDVFDVEDGLEFIESFRVTGTAVDGAVDDDVALVATGAAIERFELSSSPELSGRIVRPDFGKMAGDWMRAVAASGGEAAASAGPGVHDVALGDDKGPVLLLEQSTLSLFADDGDAEVITVIRNIGNDDLRISEPKIEDGALDIDSVDNGEEDSECDQIVLEPGGSLLVTLAGEVEGSDLQELTFETNDQGARDAVLRVETNRASPGVGDDLDDWEMLTLDGDLMTLDSLRGEVLFIKMFAPS